MTIDRKALVERHNPSIHDIQSLSPLSVGNGEFAFTVDFTGLQSFPDRYEVPLSTQSQWGWHSSGGTNRYQVEDLIPREFEFYGRKVGFPIMAEGQEEAFHWLRQNPHRVQLGQIGLRMRSQDGLPVALEAITDIDQTLEMWTGLLRSRFKVNGVPVEVLTACHPDCDQLGVRIESPLLQQAGLALSICFPSQEQQATNWSKTVPINWEQDGSHHTRFQADSAHTGHFERKLDEDGYVMRMAWSAGQVVTEDEHAYRLEPGSEDGIFTFTTSFVLPEEKTSVPLHAFAEIEAASRRHWAAFWQSGGAIELAASADSRALELERRIVTSQFLTAIHCAGSLPPQETGLLYNSWFGKMHLEMHWWHAAHFALWGRTELLRKSMGWYLEILPLARKIAEEQGYEGARWPKMVGPQGRQSPSPVGNLLIWQQPHPLLFAEYCYRADPTPDTLEQFKDIVMETAAFMASFAEWEEAGQRYVLGPPVIPAQENHKAVVTVNPTYELEYWRYALELALQWRERLGLPAEPKWEHIIRHLSELPVFDGLYGAHEHCPDTFTAFNRDHPSMLGALGILPGKKADPEIMRRTLHRVLECWQWETAWGWDFPMAAMTAARLGETNLAVDLLIKDTVKNTCLPNGHNYQRPNLMAYLPGNGGLLAAVAMMACGWQEGPDSDAPGFPDDGSWTVLWEGLNAWL